MRDDYTREAYIKYMDEYGEPDAFEKGVLFGVTQVLAMIENFKSSVYHGQETIIDSAVIDEIKREFCL